MGCLHVEPLAGDVLSRISPGPAPAHWFLGPASTPLSLIGVAPPINPPQPHQWRRVMQHEEMLMQLISDGEAA